MDGFQFFKMRFKSGNKGKVADAAEMYAALSILAILILLPLAASSSPNETKIAYTRDGVNFVSKERVEENVRFEYAKPGEYREVAVPLDTIIVGASSIPENLTISKDKEEGTKEEKTHVVSNQTVHASSAEGKYPYAAISIELLAVGGLLFFIALFFAGRDR
jgi:hypothetical protein